MFFISGDVIKGLCGVGVAFFLSVILSWNHAQSDSPHISVPPTSGSSNLTVASGEIGRFGGTLVISQRSEPKTLNPLIAVDSVSKDIIGLLTADLIHINRETQMTAASLAESWNVSPDRLRYTVHLRDGLRFSDGQPFDADDVVFTFRTYLDERIHSPQRDLLLISGQPISVRKIDKYTVLFTLSQPYAAAERLFDSIDILPQHLLRRSYEQGSLTSAWSVNTSPGQIAGLGPFRLKEYVPGQQLILERNPYYWKKDFKGQVLPYLDRIACVFASNADAEAMRFDAGETDVISDLSAADFAVLEKDQQRRHFHLYDLGPGLEYSFLFFNQNAFRPDKSSAFAQRQVWFQKTSFRQAVSSAIDRKDMVHLAYRDRAQPLEVQVTPGDKRWVDHTIEAPSRSLKRARQLMRDGGFSWTSDGSLIDSQGTPVGFSLTVNASNQEQVQMATLIQQDLKEVGIDLTLEPLEFRTFLNRIFTTYKYEAAIIMLVDGDADPNSEMNVLTSSGGTHVWSLVPQKTQTAWQLEIDRLMREQLTAYHYQERKRLYDRVQELIWKNVPVVFLASPDILVGARDRVGNFRPAILSNYTLWNAEQIFIRQEYKAAGHS